MPTRSLSSARTNQSPSASTSPKSPDELLVSSSPIIELDHPEEVHVITASTANRANTFLIKEREEGPGKVEEIHVEKETLLLWLKEEDNDNENEDELVNEWKLGKMVR